MNKKLTLIGFAVFTALTITLLVVFIVGHEEPTFIVDAPQWQHDDFPLPVEVRAYVPGGQVDALRAAVSAIVLTNTRLGFGAFRLTDGEPKVTITIGVPVEAGADAGGHSRIHHTGGRAEVCEVETANTGTLEVLGLTLRHELGHCLGLAHDDYGQSIMRPEQSPVPNREIGPWLSDDDRAAVRARYL